jgi:hypothetical protein
MCNPEYLHIVSNLPEHDHIGQNMLEDSNMYLLLSRQCALLVRLHIYCLFVHGQNAVL